MKVERVSYDVITPSAARGIFEAIFWKPAIAWKMKRIEVLHPIKWISVRRNEIGKVMSDRSSELFIEDNRQQRAGLFLKDPRYRLYAEMAFIPPEKEKHPQVIPRSQMKKTLELMKIPENTMQFSKDGQQKDSVLTHPTWVAENSAAFSGWFKAMRYACSHK
jgi:CRISPR-associated protein Cas5d